ncbi:NAD(P)/FAD-dependent oxidoreductase [Jeongeupia naejangsanensis]|uniref:FAD-dependent oxidoreductase n=1 Tax=Jeongeupia naejangsanensis TaxID=613195 RepID=A0ABS2BNQ6_9NEIS|nr:FAD-dependent oxidoreductase [Jeongeupia naejangsanensis]MBM3117264.1 FAD-dependent oxidoreductase [Jeongeupia naejangsanensis]
MNATVAQHSRIAVVGAGIAGLASAWLLSRQHHVTLFEAGSRLGGHTNTVDVTLEGHTHPVDTGFLVFNDHTYPNLIALFDELGIGSHASDMSFGVSVDDGRLEWAGSSLRTVFAQHRNLVSPGFWRMLGDILRFNRLAENRLLATAGTDQTLATLLQRDGYGQRFADDYLLPMAGAIWSSSTRDILQFPAETFLRFCLNHGLLRLSNRPQWRTVAGGGREYVRRLAAAVADIRLDTPVWSVTRHAHGVQLHTDAGNEQFDAVVLATHAPQTLRMLADASERERAVLASVRYQPNTALLHTDATLLPKRRSVWSAWNYLGDVDAGQGRTTSVSYLINRLQPLPFDTPVIVTLNPTRWPAESKLLARFEYEHPLLDTAAIAAQQMLPALQGQRRTWFAGAWTGYGFHEDGLKSALRVAADFDLLPPWAKL